MAANLTGDCVLAVALDVMDGPFDWGHRNCALAACDVIRRLHGLDLLGRFRDDMRLGLRLVARDGLLAVAADEAARLGLRTGTGAPGEIAVSLPDDEGRRSLLVALGDDFFVGKTIDGLAVIEGAEQTWSCER